MAQWFIQSAEQVLGPFSPGEVLDKVRCGTITQQTKLRKDDSAWFPAAEIGGLFEAAVKPTIRFICPVCGGTIKQPPCECPHCERHIELARREVIQHHIEPSSRTGQVSGEPGASMKGWLSRLKRRGSS
jgi:hypothetical protein